ncbi:hypothetical protein ACMX2H_04150 [Arthrobacter sulfonylureivorans]|uniref:hypothetical protein n=1 Tax=Arthrobacter sulfonylureivorans TaxID=2486855 RepID=UPI0039E723FF
MGVGDLGDDDAEQQDGSNKLQGDKLDGLADKAKGIAGNRAVDQADDHQEQHRGEQGEPGDHADDQREQHSGEQGEPGDKANEV